MLIQLLNHCSIKKQNGQKDAIQPVDLNNFKIIFILFAKTKIV